MADLPDDIDTDTIFSDLEQERLAEIEAHWSTVYGMQTAVLETTIAMLQSQTAIVDQARSFMTVLAQRGQGGHPLFMVNDSAGPDAVAQLQHAVLSLQAMLEGTEVPPLVLTDRVVH